MLYIFIFLIGTFSLSAGQPEGDFCELNATLSNITLKTFENDAQGLNDNYVEKVEELLNRDLAVNGQMDSSNHDCSIKVIGKVQGRWLHLDVATKARTLTFEPIYLTGYLEEDREKVHRLADGITNALYGNEGIASNKVLFTRKDGYKTEIWEADYDGNNLKQVTKDSGYCESPCYLPSTTGTRPSNFFFVSHKTGLPKIYLGSTMDEEVQILAPLGGSQIHPKISIGGGLVAYVSDVEGTPEIYYQTFDIQRGPVGEREKLNIGELKPEGSLTISPDGRHIAFVAKDEEIEKLYIVKIPEFADMPDELVPTPMHKGNKESIEPTWSPDGTKIAYVSPTNGVRQIWIYDIEKEKDTQMTNDKLDKENPAWAMNSHHLMYNTAGDEPSEIYLVIPGKKEPLKLLLGDGDKKYPNFTPIGEANIDYKI